MQPYSIATWFGPSAACCGPAHATEVSHKTHFDCYKSRFRATASENPIHGIPPLPSKGNQNNGSTYVPKTGWKAKSERVFAVFISTFKLLEQTTILIVIERSLTLTRD